MIKLRKDKMVALGLSHENLRRLKNNEPIKFNLEELGLGDVEMIIFSGETEETMYNDLLDLIGPKTKLR